MNIKTSRLTLQLTIVYCLAAIAGVYISITGYRSIPDTFPSVDQHADKALQTEQAFQIKEMVLTQQPDHMILSTFYRTWRLNSDYDDLINYTGPEYDTDSFEKRIQGFNDTVSLLQQIYQEAIIAIALLSFTSLVLIALMIIKPCYLHAALLAAGPVLVMFSCSVAGINYDPLGYCLVVFGILGFLIFVLQFIHSLKFGPPGQTTPLDRPQLMQYRRGLFMFTFGFFVMSSAFMMGAGGLAGGSHTGRVRLGLAILGKEGVVAAGIIAGLFMAIAGLYYLVRRVLNNNR